MSAALIQGDTVHAGFIGDCGLAILKDDGAIRWHSPDEVASVRPHFPDAQVVGTTERYIRVRRDFRNRPAADHPTYGVLTGEPGALPYVRSLSLTIGEGQSILVYTDGIMPFLFDDAQFRQLLLSGDDEALLEYVTVRSRPGKTADDKTLLIYTLNS